MANLTEIKDKVTSFLKTDVWKSEPKNRRQRLGFGVIRYFLMIFRGFSDDHCFLRATALSYTLVFSIVPVTAVVFTFLGAFDAFQQYEQQLLDFMLDQFIPKQLEEKKPDEAQAGPSAEQPS